MIWNELGVGVLQLNNLSVQMIRAAETYQILRSRLPSTTYTEDREPQYRHNVTRLLQ